MSAPETPAVPVNYLHTTTPVEADAITFGHAWADKDDGALHAIVRFGYSANVSLSSLAAAEALVAAAVKARDALAELEASAPPTTAEERADFARWRKTRAAEAETGAPAEGGEQP